MVVRENKISREGRSRKKNQLRFGQKERGGGRRKGMREREREGEGERDRETQRERQRDTERQRQRHTKKDKNRETDRDYY